LVKVNPGAISGVFAKMLETHEPTLDYEDRLKRLVRELAAHGLTNQAIDFADRLRRIPGMREVYAELVQ